MIVKLMHWFKSYRDFDRLGGFCLVLELHRGGFATIEAIPSSFVGLLLTMGEDQSPSFFYAGDRCLYIP